MTKHSTDEFYEADGKVPTVNFVGSTAPPTKGKTHRGFSDIAVKLTPNQEAIALKHDYLSRRAYNWAVGVGEFSSVLYNALKVRTAETGHWAHTEIKDGKKPKVKYVNSMGKKYLEDADREETEELFTLMKKRVRENTSYYRKYWKGKPVKGKTVSPRKIDEVRANADAHEEYKEEVNERAATEQGLYVSLFYAGLLNSISGTWETESLMLDYSLDKEDASVQLETRKKMAQCLCSRLTSITSEHGFQAFLRTVQDTEVSEFTAPYTLPSGKTVIPNKSIIKGSLSSAAFAFDRFYGGGGFPKRKKVSPSKTIRVTSFEMVKNPLQVQSNPMTGKEQSFFLFTGMGNEVIPGNKNRVQLASNYDRFQSFMNRYCTFPINPETGKPQNTMSISQCSLRFDGNQWWLSVTVGVVLPEERKRNRHKNAHDVVGIDRGARGHNMITASKPIPQRDHHIRDEEGNLVSTVPIVHIGENGHDLMNIPDTRKTTRDRDRALKMQRDLSRRMAARRSKNDEHRAECQKNHSFYHCDKLNCITLCSNAATTECQNYCDEVLAQSAKEKKLTRDIARITSSLTRRNRSYKNQAASTIARMTETVALENLNTAGMLKAPSRKFAEDKHGNRILNADGSSRYAQNSRAAKKALSRNIAKAGFGELAERMEQHGETYNTGVAKVDRYFPSSQICSQCQHRNPKTKSKNFICENCDVQLDRDINAANNIEGNVKHHKDEETWDYPGKPKTKE